MRCMLICTSPCTPSLSRCKGPSGIAFQTSCNAMPFLRLLILGDATEQSMVKSPLTQMHLFQVLISASLNIQTYLLSSMGRLNGTLKSLVGCNLRRCALEQLISAGHFAHCVSPWSSRDRDAASGRQDGTEKASPGEGGGGGEGGSDCPQVTSGLTCQGSSDDLGKLAKMTATCMPDSPWGYNAYNENGHLFQQVTYVRC